MSTQTFVILIVWFASIALADDFKTINGKEYKDATVSRVEPDGIVLRKQIWNLEDLFCRMDRTQTELRRLLRASELFPSDYYWHEETSEWKRLAELPSGKSVLATPGPAADARRPRARLRRI